MTVTTPIPDDLAPAGKRPGMGQVIRDQKKAILVALGLAVAAFWIAGQLGEWRLAGCIAGGIALGLANHLATERWLLKTISAGEEVTRGKLAASTFVRLLILTAVAVGIAVLFWPDGIGLLLGLAIFRLIALVMTITPLLRELKKDANTP